MADVSESEEEEGCQSDSYTSEENDGMIKNLSLVHKRKGKSSDPLIISLFINEILVSLEIDCGAAYSVMPQCLYRKYFSSYKLKPILKSLSVITGEYIEVLGQLEASIFFLEKENILPIIVVETGRSFMPLLGRNWLNVFYPEWRSFFLINKLNETNCAEQFRKKISNVFAEDFTKSIKGYVADIVLEAESTPIFCSPYTIAYGIREKVDKEIDRLIDGGILVPVTYSRWASPMVVVQKKSGDVRLCIDCRVTINKYVRSDHYPIPLVEDIFNEFEGCNFFSVVDLSGAFSQIELSEKSQEYLTINTHRGLLRYTRLPFGVKSALGIFQSVIDNILFGMKRVRPYMDDILIGGVNKDDCVKNTERVLRRLEGFNVNANFKKCHLIETSLEYLGLNISEEGVKPLKEKLLVIKNAPKPKDITELKSFLGLLNFYGKFIRNLSSVVAPLYSLTRKNTPFTWKSEHEKSFLQCKNLINESNILAHYSSTKPLGIVCDASSYGVGAVLYSTKKKTALKDQFCSHLQLYQKLKSHTPKLKGKHWQSYLLLKKFTNTYTVDTYLFSVTINP